MTTVGEQLEGKVILVTCPDAMTAVAFNMLMKGSGLDIRVRIGRTGDASGLTPPKGDKI